MTATTPSAASPVAAGLVDNPGHPIRRTARSSAPVASDDGASATDDPAAPAAANTDPYALEAFWAAADADPSLSNTTSVSGLIDSTGVPIGSPAALTASFAVPDTWPPASAADAVSLPVPDYITNTTYIGALEPGVPRDQQWFADWTIAVNGNKAVWRFHGGEAGTALENNTSAPTADGILPQPAPRSPGVSRIWSGRWPTTLRACSRGVRQKGTTTSAPSRRATTGTVR
ncbi:MAG: hypothetical protein U5R48_17700 [Gammaproteobacteria bacterium]|nr:hypothetical protein [Gammaproteobacteria bacterium]